MVTRRKSSHADTHALVVPWQWVGALSFVALSLGCLSTARADWDQWRGANRDGSADNSPALLSELPETGIKPLWMLKGIPAGFDGGWGSPIVWDDKVILFSHNRVERKNAKKIERKFPWLPPDKRGHLTPEEYEQYEKDRRKEDFEIAASDYDFFETTYCWDAKTGKEVWRNHVPSVYTRFVQSGTAAVHDGKIYVLGGGRKARCIDAETGKDIWETRLPGEFLDEYYMSSFAVIDGVAVVLAGNLFGLDAQTGKVLWQSGDEVKGKDCSPVAWKHDGKEYVIINSEGGKTVCWDPKAGKEVWRVESEGGNSTPVVVGDTLITYGSSRKKGLRAFKMTPAGAEHLWTFQGTSDSGSSPVVVGDHVYVQGERRVACVNLETGKTEWRGMLDLDRPRYTSLVAADGKVYYVFEGVIWFPASPESYDPEATAKMDTTGWLASVEAQKKRLAEAHPASGTEGASADKKEVNLDDLYKKNVEDQGPLECSSPAIDGGLLVVRLRKNGIVVYDLRAASQQGDRPLSQATSPAP